MRFPLARVDVTPAADLTAGYPQRTAARVRVVTREDREFGCERGEYEGSPNRPMSWARVVGKSHWLAEPCCGEAPRAEIVDAVDHLDDIPVAGLTALLGEASPVPVRPRGKRRF
ncbi:MULTISPECIES: hypothetical protein [Mycobacterium]|uniref:MmgE/PrpD C-terminal domain-containing protein n=1 Tax=Mycobacterium servetii TaxID=3237418 RepID=A0ABV4C7Z5_9MYCO